MRVLEVGGSMSGFGTLRKCAAPAILEVVDPVRVSPSPTAPMLAGAVPLVVSTTNPLERSVSWAK